MSMTPYGGAHRQWPLWHFGYHPAWHMVFGMVSMQLSLDWRGAL
ncbi:MAG TPA: hypothetical protein VF459_16835 [Caulobacteraceae bacterium]